MVMMCNLADPISSMPDSRSIEYRDEDDEDDNPYSQGRHRMSRQLTGKGRPQGKADMCPSWKGQLTEHWQEYRILLQAWNAANVEFMTSARTLQKMNQVFRDAEETAAADSLNFILVKYQQQPPPLLKMSSRTLTAFSMSTGLPTT